MGSVLDPPPPFLGSIDRIGPLRSISFVPELKTDSVNCMAFISPKKRQCNPPGREMDALTESWVRSFLSPGLSAQTQAGGREDG